MTYLYHIASPDQDREFAYLEASVLLKEEVKTPLHFSEFAVDISESAFVRLCGQILQIAPDFPELLKKIAEADYSYDQFKIELHESIRTRRDLDSHMKGIIAVADVLRKGNPNLSNPSVWLDVVADDSGYYFLERFCVSNNSWRAHIKKPYSFSSSVSAKHSRALVNIACPNAKTFLDPCCGFGNVVLEAAYLGLDAAGNDINEKQVWYAEQNLKHFGYPIQITQLDALTLLSDSAVDAVVVDFPYGLNSHTTDHFYHDFIRYYHSRTKRLVTLTAIPFANDLEAAGYQILGIAMPTKGHIFKRYITLAVPI